MNHKYISIKPPTGTRDLSPCDVSLRNMLVSNVEKYFKLYGGQPIDTPIFEYMDTVKNLYGEEFDKLVYTLDDDTENEPRKLLLRYDLTLPCCRYIVNNGLLNFKKYQIGKVYRKDNPQTNKGRYREFLQ